MATADLVKTCVECGATRSRRFFLPRGASEYTSECGVCRRRRLTRERMRRYAARDADTAYFDRGRRVGRAEADAEAKVKRAKDEFCVAFNAFAIRECSRAIVRLRGNLANGAKTHNMGRVNKFRVKLIAALDETRCAIEEVNKYAPAPVLRPIMMMLPPTRDGIVYHWEFIGNPRVKPFAGLDEYAPPEALVCLERAYDVGDFEHLLPDTQEAIKEFVRSYHDIQRKETGIGRPDGGWATEWVSPRVGELVDEAARKAARKVTAQKAKTIWQHAAEGNDEAVREMLRKDGFVEDGRGSFAAPSPVQAQAPRHRNGRPPIEQTLARAYVKLYDAQRRLNKITARPDEHYARRA